MRNFGLQYELYGCIAGIMLRKIWDRAHERSKINLRPVFQPDSSGKTRKNYPQRYHQASVARVIPIDKPVGLRTALRPIYGETAGYCYTEGWGKIPVPDVVENVPAQRAAVRR